MNRKEYWQKRFELLEQMELDNAETYIKDLEEQFVIAYNEVEKKVLQWYNRYAKENSISFAEAKIQLNKGELKEFQWSVEEYIKYANENGLDIIWQQQLKNASARVHISRLDALRTHIQHEVEKLYNKQLKGLESIEEMLYTDTYYHTVYELQVGHNIGFSFQGIDDNKVRKILSKPWGTDDSTFSDRIWNNKQDLINVLKKELTQATIKGTGLKEVTNTILNKFNVKANKVGRLVMTESAFFASAAQKDCFSELNVQKCMILGTLDSHTCKECGSLDGKIVNMKDFEPGLTVPPFHPWCRCTTIPYFEDEFEFGERAARDSEGKTYFIPKNITYEQWKEKYAKYNVTNSKEAKKSVIKINNKTKEFVAEKII